MPQHSRIPEPTSALVTFNPFSPQKNKGKKPIRSSANAHRTPWSPNPDSQSTQFSSLAPVNDDLHNQTDPAVLRAKKRLRGEIVSPSPRKPKLPRNELQAPPLPALKLDVHVLEDNDRYQESILAIGISPQKPHANGKHFTLLFDDEVAQDGDGANYERLMGRKTHSTSNLFGNAMSSASEIVNRDSSIGPDNKISRLLHSLDPDDATNPFVGPRNDNSDTTMGDLQRSPVRKEMTKAVVEAIQPSAAKTTKRGTKTKASGVFKTTVYEGDGEKDPLTIMTENVKVVDRPRFVRAVSSVDEVEFEVDPTLARTRITPRTRTLAFQNSTQETNTISIDLPDDLLEVLALESRVPNTQRLDEERMAEGIIYGRRVWHYDPSRGGEIWDIGEDATNHARSAPSESEDDWEGEPIPWAAGEL